MFHLEVLTPIIAAAKRFRLEIKVGFQYLLGKGPKKKNYESFDICQTVGR